MAQIMNKGSRLIYYASSVRSILRQLGLRSLASASPTNHSKLNMHVPSDILAHDTNFPLPGNVSIDLESLDKKEASSLQQQKPKYNSLAGHLMKLESDSIRKRDIIDQYMKRTERPSPSRTVECTVQECPKTLKRGFQELFADVEARGEELTVITIAQNTINDMSVWTEDVETEREQLIATFIDSATAFCRRIHEHGFWADFIEPSSGAAYFGRRQNALLQETDDRFNQLGFRIEDLGCCKVLAHDAWQTNVFVGVIFTNAPSQCHIFNDM